MQRIGILGGTFNPVHIGHLIMAERAWIQFHLDRILWVPTFCPPYKRNDSLLPFHHRAAMVRLAIASHPTFQLTFIEQELGGISYAADTLQALQQRYPAAHWHWVIGEDAFQTLPRWRDCERLIQHCKWLIAPRWNAMSHRQSDVASIPQAKLHQNFIERSHFTFEQLSATALAIDWDILHIPLVSISSSLIRQLSRDRDSIRYMVPEAVRAYILQNQLYQND